MKNIILGVAILGFGIAMGIVIGGQGDSESRLDFVTANGIETSRIDPARSKSRAKVNLRASEAAEESLAVSSHTDVPMTPQQATPNSLVPADDHLLALAERRRKLDDKTPQFDFFEGSMTRMLGDPQLALDAWEMKVELSSLLRICQKTGTPLPSEGVILDRIKKRLGAEPFETMQTIFASAPITNEVEFTRHLHRYRRTDKNGELKPLVLRGLNELAIWFVSRDTARQWGYIR